MRLASLRLTRVPPFGDVTLPFADEDGAPRSVTVLLGGGGVGKTSVVGAIASTRPGNTSALGPGGEAGPLAVASYILGRDDPDRPHPLVVAGPNGRVFDVEATELLRRKEQAHFDRIAKDGGYVFLAVPSTRWFSRQAITLSAPARTVARYDVRATTPLDDATRSDLTREVKQALAYAAIAAALSRDRGGATYLRLGEAMAQTVDTLASLGGYSYAGLDPATLEPMFRGDDGTSATFDALPTRVRHLVTFAALPVRALWGGYPGRDPREAEGIVAIDEVELQQDGAVLGRIVPALRAALPGVQWIVTTSSAAVAASVEPSETLALRRLPQATDVQVFGDGAATVH